MIGRRTKWPALGLLVLAVVIAAVGAILAAKLAFRSGMRHLDREHPSALKSMLEPLEAALAMHRDALGYLAVLPRTDDVLLKFVGSHDYVVAAAYFPGDGASTVMASRLANGTAVSEQNVQLPQATEIYRKVAAGNLPDVTYFFPLNYASGFQVRTQQPAMIAVRALSTSPAAAGGYYAAVVSLDRWVDHIRNDAKWRGCNARLVSRSGACFLDTESNNFVFPHSSCNVPSTVWSTANAASTDTGALKSLGPAVLYWKRLDLSLDALLVISDFSHSEVASMGSNARALTALVIVILECALVGLAVSAWYLYQRRQMQEQNRYVEELCRKIAVMDLDGIRPSGKDFQSERWLQCIIQNLRRYRPYLPDTLRRTDECGPEKSEDDERGPNLGGHSDVEAEPLTPILLPEAPQAEHGSRPSASTVDLGSPTLRRSNTTGYSNVPSPANSIHISFDPSEENSLLPTTVTLLTISIDDFSALCDTYPPQLIAALHGDYIAVIEQVIKRHRGRIHSFTADTVVASFNAATRLANHEVQAVRAAINGVEAFSKLCNRYPALPLNRCRFVVTTGKALVGNCGSNTLRSFCIMGAFLQHTAVFDALCKELGVTLLIDEGVNSKVKANWATRAVDIVRVDEEAATATAYELLAHCSNPEWMYKPESFSLYTQAFRSFVAGDSRAALVAVRQFLHQPGASEDALGRRLVRMIASYHNTPIPYANALMLRERGPDPASGYRTQRQLLDHIVAHMAVSEDVKSFAGAVRIPSLLSRLLHEELASAEYDQLFDLTRLNLPDERCVDRITFERDIYLRRFYVSLLVRRLPPTVDPPQLQLPATTASWTARRASRPAPITPKASASVPPDSPASSASGTSHISANLTPASARAN